MDELTEKQIERIEQDCSPVDTDEMYDDMLDECCGPVHIGALEYGAAYALKELDPTAYRCGKVDYLDGETRDGGLCEVNGEYYQEADVQEVLEELADEDEDE